MKQCEKISGLVIDDPMSHHRSWGTIEGPVVICTVEELSDLWNAGYRAGMSDFGHETKLPAVDFETYLKSKGINI